jgi:endonuclease III
MPDLKGEYIIGCFERIRCLGGPEAAKAELLAQVGREAKIQWLKTMPGIGDKYARNIMMDVYHKDFRNSIAVDARIKSVSDALDSRSHRTRRTKRSTSMWPDRRV